MKPIRRHILVCNGSDCKKKGNKKAYKQVKKAIKSAGDNFTRCSRTQCLGACKHAPVMVVYPDGTWYEGIKSEKDIQAMVDEHIVSGRPAIKHRLHQMPAPSFTGTD